MNLKIETVECLLTSRGFFMNYLYYLINENTNKKFVGKSSLPKWALKIILYDLLDDGEHYNKLLQKDWKRNTFRLIFDDVDNVGEECDKIINNENLLNPKNGYNVYADLRNNRGRFKKNDVFSDDLCLLFCWHKNIQYLVRTLGLERNTISNRLANFELFENDYFARNIARYDDYNFTSMRLLYLEEVCLTANQIMDKMLHRYNVSGMLRVTPRKISSFYSVQHIPSVKDKKQGCLVFCPKIERVEKND